MPLASQYTSEGQMRKFTSRPANRKLPSPLARLLLSKGRDSRLASPSICSLTVRQRNGTRNSVTGGRWYAYSAVWRRRSLDGQRHTCGELCRASEQNCGRVGSLQAIGGSRVAWRGVAWCGVASRRVAGEVAITESAAISASNQVDK